ncbi:MAG: hypothetical protein Q8R92_10600 [Deltaproteobacteria bacterium]|nr:hypothetical protein [Deltaproteobacteria bacterium]
MLLFDKEDEHVTALCEVLHQELGVTCVSIYTGEGRKKLEDAGIQFEAMGDAWYSFIDRGEDSEIYRRGVETLGVEVSIIPARMGAGPVNPFTWQAHYDINTYSVHEPAKILAHEEVRVNGWGFPTAKKAYRKAALAAVRALERRPSTWQAATGYPGQQYYDQPLPPIPVAVWMMLRLPRFKMRADTSSLLFKSGLSVEPLWWKDERNFRIALVDAFKEAFEEPARITLRSFPLEEVMDPRDYHAFDSFPAETGMALRDIRKKYRGAWTPYDTLMRLAHEWNFTEPKGAFFFRTQSHHAVEMHEKIVRWNKFGTRAVGLETRGVAGWACPPSKRFFRLEVSEETDPYAGSVSLWFYGESAVDDALLPEPLPEEVSTPLPVRGETWAYFKGPFPKDGRRHAPDYMLRLVEGGSRPEVIASEPVDPSGETGYRWFEVAYPLKDLQFPLRPGKTWTMPAGEQATVKAGVVLQPENLAAFPITFEKQGKVTRTLYYAPEVNAIAREEDAEGKTVLSLWLSAVRYVPPAQDEAKPTSH